ncbi:hypothetical protein OG693_39205 (plasmid) [Streptomyces sp. NBC_01259]|uniref:hypothetical protein n=1 Tax=Streptomyces sp. NBC_01259 TaxID=2903800 RepID=UPI002F918EF5
MSILTITLDLLDNPHNPDHAHGRATAYDAIHDGTPLNLLDDRLAWMEDPTVSGTTYTAAYLAGYRAQIADWRAYDYAQRIAVTHNAWEANR